MKLLRRAWEGLVCKCTPRGDRHVPFQKKPPNMRTGPVYRVLDITQKDEIDRSHCPSQCPDLCGLASVGGPSHSLKNPCKLPTQVILAATTPHACSAKVVHAARRTRGSASRATPLRQRTRGCVPIGGSLFSSLTGLVPSAPRSVKITRYRLVNSILRISFVINISAAKSTLLILSGSYCIEWSHVCLFFLARQPL